GSFRRDLMYRLNAFTLNIPPLRERVSELEPLLRAFSIQASKDAGLPRATFSQDALLCLRRYAWPGNIRELKNVVTRAVLLAAGGEVRPEHLPPEVLSGGRSSAGDPLPMSPSAAEPAWRPPSSETGGLAADQHKA